MPATTCRDNLPGADKAAAIRAANRLARNWIVANLSCIPKSGVLPNGGPFGGSKVGAASCGTAHLLRADRKVIARCLIDPEGGGTAPQSAEPAATANMNHSTMDMTNEN